MPVSAVWLRLGQSFRQRAAAAFTLDTRSLASYRIGLGCLLVADSLLRSRDVSLMLSPDGIMPPDLVRTYLGSPTQWSLALAHDALWWNGCVLGLEALAGLLLVAGLYTRAATILGWIAVVSLIRRTVLANNSGDLWLACQLLWASFLPLSARWSLEGRRPGGEPPPAAAFSAGTVALVLQLVAVYLGAGLAKCNASWVEGHALTRALSVHDHGTSLGMAIRSLPWLIRPLQWAVPIAEIALPLLVLAVPTARMRLAVVAVAITFHAGISLLMSVGLFAAIGVVAWLPLIPAAAWPAGSATAGPRRVGLSRPANLVCGLLLGIAALAFVIQSVIGRSGPLPQPLATAVNLAFLPQEWRMFGTVRDQEQWVSCRGITAGRRTVDPLRGGRPATTGPPAGGFPSLPNHRWHRFLWRLPEPAARPFAAAAAAGIARHWNRSHPPADRVVAVEIWCGTAQVGDGGETVRDILLAAWPPRSPTGEGGLDRFLRARPGPAGAR